MQYSLLQLCSVYRVSVLVRARIRERAGLLMSSRLQGQRFRERRVSDLATAVEIIEGNDYGNGVAIFTSDGGAAREFAFSCRIP